jgi:hypothetical protein
VVEQALHTFMELDNQYGIFVSGAYHQLTGNNVDSNTRKKSLLESLKPWLKLLTPPLG